MKIKQYVSKWQTVTEEIKKKKILETNDMTTQNTDAAKAVLRGKCIAIKS